MRALLDDVRYGLTELLRAPHASSRTAVWLLAGVVLGIGLARGLDGALVPLAVSEPPGVPAAAVTRVPASRLLGREAEGRLRCLVGHPSCRSTPAPSPCALGPVAARDS